MARHLVLYSSVAVLAGVLAAPLAAKEIPIGKPQTVSGMEIAAVYLQPIEMEPEGMMRAAKESDVHLETDIKASKDNPNGFAEGDWMPYLSVAYKLDKTDGGWSQSGDLMPMVANDGPHYGDNVKLAGPGKYKLSVTVKPPGSDPKVMFGRHVDKESGVGAWFKPLTVSYEFTYAGTGKKGGY